MDVDDVYFQQDGATCHISSETIGHLCEKFPDRVISRKGDYNWPPRSCDLTPLDFSHWGYVKDKVYANPPQSIKKLKEKIRTVIDEIEPQMCENVMENVIKRAWLRWPDGFIRKEGPPHSLPPPTITFCHTFIPIWRVIWKIIRITIKNIII